MKRKLNIIFILLITIYLHGLGSTKQLFEEGNKAYVAGNYDTAITIYESILQKGFESSGLYYNLGNAYFKANNIPKAILNYERAKRIDPNDEEIQFNLELANSMVIDKLDVIPEIFLLTWLKKFIYLLPVDNWGILSLSLFIIGLIIFLIYLFSSKYRIKKSSFIIATIAILISILSFFMAFTQQNMIRKHNAAIIVSQSVTVKGSPDENGTDLFIIHEGTKVIIEDKVDDWREIKLSNGNKGWLKTNTIEVI